MSERKCACQGIKKEEEESCLCFVAAQAPSPKKVLSLPFLCVCMVSRVKEFGHVGLSSVCDIRTRT